MKSNRKHGPDSGWSWVIALCCFFIYLILYGIYRTSGILLVAFINEYHLSREESSWPLFLCFSFVDLTGLFVGPIGQKFGIRPITIVGSLISAVGVSLCYFANSLIFITVSFGVIFGIGFGLASTLIPVIINEYFLKHRATANGLAQSGACIGSVILPPLYEYLIHEYGLNNCLLLVGGVILQLLIAASLMRPPTWSKKSRNFPERDILLLNTFSDSTVLKDDEMIPLQSHTGSDFYKSHSLEKLSDDVTISDQKDCAENGLSLDSVLLYKTIKEEAREMQQNTLKNDMDKEKSDRMSTVLNTDEIVQSQAFSNAKSSNAVEYEIKVSSTKNINYVSEHYSKNYKSSERTDLTIFKMFKKVMTCPMFYVLAFTNVTFYTFEEIVFVINADFFMDKGIEETDVKYIIIAFSVCDLAGNLCLGWVTDRNYIRRSHFMILCMVSVAAVFICFPFADGYVSLMILNCFYGLIIGSVSTIFAVIPVDYLDMDVQEVVFGTIAFMCGTVTLTAALVIGYFRDYLGSYTIIFYIMGSVSLIIAASWLLENVFVKADRTQKVKNSVTPYI